MPALLAEVEEGDEVEEDGAEGGEGGKDAEPGEHELAFVFAGGRRGNAKDQVEAAEEFGEEWDHDALPRRIDVGGRSVGHGADFFFDFGDVHHDDGVPGAAIEEAAVGALAEALLAADALKRIDLDAAERRIVLVGDPEHAVFDRAVLDAGGRAGAAGAAFGDDGKLFGFFLARGGDALGARLLLHLVGHQSRGFSDYLLGGHGAGLYLRIRGFGMCHLPQNTGRSAATGYISW